MLSQLPKRIELQGARNFRDMGGYSVANGRTIQFGKLYRSDQLCDLTDSDADVLNAIGIRTVVDFRRSNERGKSPNHPINPDVNHISLPVVEKGTDVFNVWKAIEGGELDAESARSYLIKANAGFISRHSQVYADFMALLMNPDNYPLVFHCAAGKDRAGFAAASVLMNLGASHDVIFHDYLATGHSTQALIEHLLGKRPTLSNALEGLTALLQVHPEYLGEAFLTIERAHGSIDAYLQSEQKMDAKKREALANILCGISE
ncbi:Tyrosine-protein phosphatase [Zhongshania aliphaticivorans]|uniref:Tyrosine-protein phosphatase n=2 Tax=Zhongshania aliphaticivorans TaxID=1470434 RepID=A0A5S9NRE2_9GAMM|nr:Tyrosine-protein phosphatase [Zhongshania aliphaticivorans]CAA0110798.1 Tyrosine-protein phosphatase [Zhongshania aliphaticivorans]